MFQLLKEFKTISGVSYAKVYYDEDNNTIMDVWNGVFGSQENFRNVISFIQEEITSRHITKWLADLRDMNGSFDGSRDWMTQQVMPQLIQAGLLFEAIVLPKNVFAKLSTRDAIMKIHNFELRQFADIEQAKVWLNQTNAALA